MAILATVFYLSPRGTSISVCPVPDSTTPSTPFHHFVAPRLASAPSTAVTHFTPLPPALWLCFPAVAQRLPPPAVPESSLSSPRHSSCSLSLSLPTTGKAAALRPSTHCYRERGHRGRGAAAVPELGARSAMAGRLVLALPVLLLLLLVGESLLPCRP